MSLIRISSRGGAVGRVGSTRRLRTALLASTPRRLQPRSGQAPGVRFTANMRVQDRSQDRSLTANMRAQDRSPVQDRSPSKHACPRSVPQDRSPVDYGRPSLRRRHADCCRDLGRRRVCASQQTCVSKIGPKIGPTESVMLPSCDISDSFGQYILHSALRRHLCHLYAYLPVEVPWDASGPPADYGRPSLRRRHADCSRDLGRRRVCASQQTCVSKIGPKIGPSQQTCVSKIGPLSKIGPPANMRVQDRSPVDYGRPSLRRRHADCSRDLGRRRVCASQQTCVSKIGPLGRRRVCASQQTCVSKIGPPPRSVPPRSVPPACPRSVPPGSVPEDRSNERHSADQASLPGRHGSGELAESSSAVRISPSSIPRNTIPCNGRTEYQ